MIEINQFAVISGVFVALAAEAAKYLTNRAFARALSEHGMSGEETDKNYEYWIGPIILILLAGYLWSWSIALVTAVTFAITASVIKLIAIAIKR